MKAVLAPTALIHSLKVSATESRALSDLTNRGTPGRMSRSDNALIASTELSLRFTLMDGHSGVTSSRMFSVRNALSQSVRQSTKSWFRRGHDALACTGCRTRPSAIIGPSSVASSALSASPGKRPIGAFPDLPQSRRNSRSTRSSLTCHPVSLFRAATHW